MSQVLQFGWGAVALLLVIFGCSGRADDGVARGGSPPHGGATSGGSSGRADAGRSGFSGSAFAGRGGTGAGGAVDAASGGTSNGGAASASESGMGGGAGAGGEDLGASGSGGSASGCLGRDFDLRATLVSGKVTVNGNAISDPTSEGLGQLLLMGETDSVLLTDTSSRSYSALVMRGTYDLYYGHLADGSAVPINGFVRLVGGIVVDAAPLTLDIDVPAVRVTGALTVNGAIADVANTGPGSVYFVSPEARSTLLATTASGSYSALVVPGTYDLAYSYPDGSAVPLGNPTHLGKAFEVGPASTVVDIDVPLTRVSVTVTMNGLPRSAASDAGTLFLADANGEAYLSASSPSSPYSGRVVPGSYDLYWHAPDQAPSDATVPRNGGAKLRSGVVVGSDPLSFSLDIPVTTVSGRITVNGIPAETLGKYLGSLTLQGSTGGNPYFPVDAGSYSLSLVAGTYDAFFEHGSTKGISPSNSYTQLPGAIVVGSTPLSRDIDIPATRVSGNITVNGKAISQISHPDFSLLLRAAVGSATLVEYPTQNAYSALVIPGTYDLYYAAATEGRPEIPGNFSARLQTGIVVGSTPLSLDVDIRSTLLDGRMTLNGAAVADSGTSSALILSNADGLSAIVRPHGSGYSALLVPGTYEVRYDGYNQGHNLPNNNNTYLGCFYVP